MAKAQLGQNDRRIFLFTNDMRALAIGLVLCRNRLLCQTYHDFSGFGEMVGSDRSRMMRAARALRRRATEPPLAAKADDLEALKKTIEDAASVSGGLWLSYLFVLFYIAVAAGAVTHADLLLESPVKLPFSDIELPLKAFFSLAPILFLITHAYTLVHFALLAKKAGRFHEQLLAQIPGRENENARAVAKREGLRGQLPSNIFVQFLAGSRDVREGSFGVLLKIIAWTTLVVWPVLLFLLLQIQFLPCHHSGIVWTLRIALVADLGLVWWLWRAILSGRGDFRRFRSWTKWAAPALGIVLSCTAVLFSWTVATFPGEWQEEHLPSFTIVPTKWFGPEWVPADEPFKSRIPAEWISLHEWFFDGDVDLATRRRVSLFSNTLVLPGFNIYDALKIDDPKRWNGKITCLICANET